MAPVMKVKYLESFESEEPTMSRTDQYRKVMKPLLERKRRARINTCLDELKDLMVYALQSEGESISKLEKADVLELTVRHLRKLKRQQMLAMNPGLDLDRFHAGYTTCATEVSKCLASTGVDISVGSKLMSHLGHKLNTIETSRVSPLNVRVPGSGYVPGSPAGSDCGYSSERSGSPSSLPSPQYTTLLQISPSIKSEPAQLSPVWRPF